ncbi:AraC family transcriptional regulator [Vibrio rotiferianus]|uniref:AraC family transcriptional regulator n=1 Tax=Vibrio rotiferianus TaxID=190895 RepID=A0ABX3DB23_9VIBR|nr:AraC family transcriptional regulator [Vibrio rotiferianus]OHY94893.1 AraC family transcriptional regulator [Vibrio rotiferianus]
MFKTFSYKGVAVQKLRNVVIVNPSIIWIVNGEKKLSIGNNGFLLKPTDSIIISANKKIVFENIPKNGLFYSKQLCFLTKPNAELIRLSRDNAVDEQSRLVKLDSHFKQILELIFQSDSILKNQDTRRLWVEGIYSTLAEKGLLHLLFPSHEITFDEKVYDLLESLTPEEHKIDTVCLYLGVSKPTLIRRLKKTGTQFKRIVKQVRMNKALHLIQNGVKSLDDIANFCGYQSVQLFSQYFVEQIGMDPISYMTSLSCEKENISKHTYFND